MQQKTKQRPKKNEKTCVTHEKKIIRVAHLKKTLTDRKVGSFDAKCDMSQKCPAVATILGVLDRKAKVIPGPEHC